MYDRLSSLASKKLNIGSRVAALVGSISIRTDTQVKYYCANQYHAACMLYDNLDSRVVLSQGSNTRRYNILGPMCDNPRWRIAILELVLSVNSLI